MAAAAKTREKVVWEGAPALRRYLVPIVDLAPSEGNPRRGDVAAIRESLREFGQVQAILVDETGRRIVAGEHRVLAAYEEGWTHVAAIPAEFKDEAAKRRYLLADNRTHDRGSYDLAELDRQLRALQAEATLEGTGYSDGFVVQLGKDLAAAAARATPPAEFPPLDPDALKTDFRCPVCAHEWSGSPKPGA